MDLAPNDRWTCGVKFEAGTTGERDVTPWPSMGSKYAQRFGKLRDSRVGGPWYSSRADLVVVRTDLHLLPEWT